MSVRVMSMVWSLRDPSLKLSERMVLLKLADHANDDGVCWPGQSKVAADCGMSRRAVVYAVKSLQEKGYLKVRTARDEDGKRSLNSYTVMPCANLAHGCESHVQTTTDPCAQVAHHHVQNSSKPCAQVAHKPSGEPSGEPSEEPSCVPQSEIDLAMESIERGSADKERDEQFEKWWTAYDRKVGRHKARLKWDRLTETERIRCLATVDAYVATHPERQYRKHPTTYLNGRHWEDEIRDEITDPTHPDYDPRPFELRGETPPHVLARLHGDWDRIA